MVNREVTAGRGAEVTYRNYAQRGYVRVLHGAYAPMPDPASAPRDARGAAFRSLVGATMGLYRDAGAVLYGPTALQVLGVALPEKVEDWERCHILTPHAASSVRRRGVVAHRSRRPIAPWRVVDGWPVQHPVDHWLQLAGADQDALIEVGDGLVRRGKPLLTLAEVRARVAQLAGRPGIAAIREACQWLEPGTDSLYETRTRLVLVHAGLPRPAVNPEVFCPSSGMTYHLDMAYLAEKVGVEYDGAQHVADRRQMEIDAIRRRDLQDDGWTIISVTVSQLREPAELVRVVESALIMRHARARHAW